MHPAFALTLERSQAASALPSGGAVAFAPGGMSGEFAKRLLAEAGAPDRGSARPS